MGVMAGAFHAMWALLVACGWAQTVIDFVLRIHFITPIYVVAPFDWVLAAELIAATTASGYIIGAGFALMWNWCVRNSGANGNTTRIG